MSWEKSKICIIDSTVTKRENRFDQATLNMIFAVETFGHLCLHLPILWETGWDIRGKQHFRDNDSNVCVHHRVHTLECWLGLRSMGGTVEMPIILFSVLVPLTFCWLILALRPCMEEISRPFLNSTKDYNNFTGRVYCDFLVNCIQTRRRYFFICCCIEIQR